VETVNGVAGVAAPRSDQEVATSVAEDLTIEDEIDRLADKLSAFCFGRLEEDLHSGCVKDIVDMNMDQGAFDEELRVRDSNAMLSRW
jgi:hypothetical protein